MRLADLLVGLSRVADLGFGLPMGAAARSCVLATRLARSCGLPAAEVRAAFYTALLHHVGCAGYARETARLFGDELAANMAAGRTDAASARDVFATFLPALTHGRPALERARLAFIAVTKGGRWGDQFTITACELGRDCARRLQLPQDVQNSLFHVYDRWRGQTRPGELNGEDVPVGARIARLTGIAVLFEFIGGSDLAVQAVQRRAGGMLDPGLVARFTGNAAQWLTDLPGTGASSAVLGMEPHPHVMVPRACALQARSSGIWPTSRARISLAIRAPSRRWPLAPPGSSACRRGPRQTWRWPGCCTMSAGSPSPARCGKSPVRSAPTSGNRCGCTRIVQSASWSARPGSRGSRRLPGGIMNGWTAVATTAVARRRSWPCQRGSWPQRTPTGP